MLMVPTYARLYTCTPSFKMVIIVTLIILLFLLSGATRSHLDSFKKQRAARIDHYVVEVNKRIIRLEKVSIWNFYT